MRILNFLSIITLSLMFIFLASIVEAKTIKVAVIDTGFDYKSNWEGVSRFKTYDGIPLKRPKLCKDGHIDLTGTSTQDTHGHGTHVAGIIATYAGNSDYCLIIIKNFDENGTNTDQLSVKAFAHAIKMEVDVINYSGGGDEFIMEEYDVVKQALDKGIVIVAAAGNLYPENIDHIVDHVSKSPTKPDNMNKTFEVRYVNNITLESSYRVKKGYYPAIYDKRIYSVQSTDRSGVIHETSNKGAAFSHKEVGVDVLSLHLNNKVARMTGTSMAAPKITAKIIKGFKKSSIMYKEMK